jgi:hypothetical protein
MLGFITRLWHSPLNKATPSNVILCGRLEEMGRTALEPIVKLPTTVSPPPSLTQTLVTYIYSSLPTEEAKKSHHRGKRGGGKKKKTSGQSDIVTSKIRTPAILMLYHGNVSSSQPYVLCKQRRLCLGSAQVCPGLLTLFTRLLEIMSFDEGPFWPLLP